MMLFWQRQRLLATRSFHSVRDARSSSRRDRACQRRMMPTVALLEERTLLSTITTVAGNGTLGYTGDGGPATAAELYSPTGVAVDAHGNIFISDTYNNVIREVNAATGKITTVAGDGIFGYSGDGGLATHAELSAPKGIALDAAGNLYIADQSNNAIRKVNLTTGIITTVATSALNGPDAVAVDAHGNIFISDYDNDVIREVSAATGTTTTVAGDGVFGYSGDGGPATHAELDEPDGVAVDAFGDLFIADSGNDVIREVNAATGIITTVATVSPGPIGIGQDGVAVDASGDIFIADDGDNVIREVSAATGKITTVAGTGSYGYAGDGGPATSALLNNPSGIAVDAHGDIIFSDYGNDVVREVTAAGVPTPTPPATVQQESLEKIKTGKRKSAEVIVLQFSEALNAGDAQNTGTYSLATVSKTKKQKSKPVALAQASYNATMSTVTLRTRSPLVLNPPIELTIKAVRLLDALGRPLDGNYSGQSGANFVAVLSKGGISVIS